MSGHVTNEVQDVVDGYVLVCGCGWRSPASASAAEIGREWDRHRSAAGDGN